MFECEWQLVLECEWQLVFECERQLVFECEWQLGFEYEWQLVFECERQLVFKYERQLVFECEGQGAHADAPLLLQRLKPLAARRGHLLLGRQRVPASRQSSLALAALPRHPWHDRAILPLPHKNARIDVGFARCSGTSLFTRALGSLPWHPWVARSRRGVQRRCVCVWGWGWGWGGGGETCSLRVTGSIPVDVNDPEQAPVVKVLFAAPSASSRLLRFFLPCASASASRRLSPTAASLRMRSLAALVRIFAFGSVVVLL